jgi:glutaredoxin 3
MSIQQLVANQLKQAKIVIFSKTYCPYCIKVKELFKNLQQEYQAIELDTINNGQEIQDYLYTLTKQRTVPSVFINQKHVGGCDDVHELHRKGKLLL